MNNQQVFEVDCPKHLGLFLSNDGSWHHQINCILEIALCKINIMRKLKFRPFIQRSSDLYLNKVMQFRIIVLSKT